MKELFIFSELSQPKNTLLKTFKYLLLSTVAALMMYIAWPPQPITIAVFFAFIPLLFIADTVSNKKLFFAFVFIALLLWNVFTTWWIWNSTSVGSIFAIVANSFVMYLPWWGYYHTKNKFNKQISYLALICFWMLFEYIHLNWELSWPWLSLGNVFANSPYWIQWYEYTGVGGGTLWILFCNILIFETTKQWSTISAKVKFGYLLAVIFAISFPIIISYQIANNREKLIAKANENVVIIQPNIDPYLKFESGNINSQIEKLVSLTASSIDSNTVLVLWPETALSSAIPEDAISNATVYKPIFDFLKNHPKITLVSGIETYKIMSSETKYSQKTTQDVYYESYNAAIAINSNKVSNIYIKSKLVPGVETLPSFLKILSPVFERFGGTTGGYAKDETSKVFQINNQLNVAPVICYESIYGEYLSTYIKKGANLITILTNDGWWGNTAGHKQHLAYAKLRAIETRCWIVRSANTGISAVINDYGLVLNTLDWNKEGAIKQTVQINNAKSFYVQHGDYLYFIFSIIAFILIGYFLFILLRKNKKTQ